MNFRQMEAFDAVMKTGSMTLAGKLLYISQPAVSRLILELEQEVGFKLFERKKNGLSPTMEGELLYEEVEKSFVGLRELSQTADSIRELRRGMLRIIAMPGVTHLMLPSVMEHFWGRFPNINVEIESHPRTVVIDWIHSKQFDIGIANLPIDSNEIQVGLTFDVRMMCVMPEHHRLARKERLRLADLRDESLVTFPLGTYVRHQVEELLEKNQVKCRIKLSARSTSDIYQYVKHGAGISLVFPFDQFGESTIAGLVFRPVEVDFYMQIGIMHSKRRKCSIAAMHFLTVMEELIQQRNG